MNSIARKLRKLKNNPTLFFKDMWNKQITKIKQQSPVKYNGKFQYTIVSAVYNVEKYLDDYFKSIVNQSLDFKKHIHIICVDDGSSDHSAQIIHKWQKKYPNNISYFLKENGGQASARNLGLEYVKTNWVTFIDPDDFIHVDYFKTIDDALGKEKDLVAVITNQIFYIEESNTYQDTHPLKYRFAKNSTTLPAQDLKQYMAFHVGAAMFSYNHIINNNIFFDQKVKPNFEDGKFIADYLLFSEEKQQVVFLKKAIYFYRKRADGSSTIDKSWGTTERFYDVLKYGHLEMLRMYAAQYKKIPEHVQRTTLYDIAWYAHYLRNSPEKISFLSEEQKQKFFDLLSEIMALIDNDIILSFNLARVWFLQKVGMLGAFKNQPPPFQISYVENVDREKQQVLVSYFDCFSEDVSYRLDGQDVIPKFHKTTCYTFADRPFVNEYRAWIPFTSVNQKLTISIGKLNARITVAGKQYYDGITIGDILGAFQPSAKYRTDGSWLIMDRDTQADDNAEHFYRYMQHNHPDQKCYFALNRDAHDWQRLQQEGFNLVAYGTTGFERRLRASSKIISSHLDRYINNYFGDEYEYSKKFIFLQHGITIHNQSNWFNMKKNLQLIITATKPEYESIVSENNHYKLTKKEVYLTGFPRHDQLLKSNLLDSKIILIMPTWREFAVGKVLGKGNAREFNKSFSNTEYFQHWKAVLHNQRLESLSKKYGFQVIFAPHANVAPYLSLFHVPDYISTWRLADSEESIQKIFQKSKLMITDYSSVAFEMAYLHKTVLYYQFDKEKIFSGSHVYKQGYFSYENDGFGPVAYTEEELFKHLEVILQNDGAPTEPYATRIRETFPFRDGKNCERVYQAIMDLDTPDDGKINLTILRQFLEQAVKHQDWKLVEHRASLLLEHGQIEDQPMALEKKYQALIAQNKLEEVQPILSQLPEEAQISYRLKCAFKQQQWQQAADILANKSNVTEEELLAWLHCYVELNNPSQFIQVMKTTSGHLYSEDGQHLIDFWQMVLSQDWQAVIDYADILNQLPENWLKEYQPQLQLARAYRYHGNFDLAHQTLVAFEKHSLGTPNSRLEIAHLAYAQRDFVKVIKQLDLVFSDIVDFPSDSLKEYLIALKVTKSSNFQVLFDKAVALNPYDEWYALQQQDWGKAIQILEAKESPTNADILNLLHCYIELDCAKDFTDTLAQHHALQYSDNEKILISLWQAEAQKDWGTIIDMKEEVNNLPGDMLSQYHPQLSLARAYRHQRDFDAAHQTLVAFEKHSFGAPNSRLEIAHLAYARRDFAKVIKQIDQIPRDVRILPEKNAEEYLSALVQQKSPRILSILQQLSQCYADREWYQYQSVMLALSEKRWTDILEIVSKLSNELRSQLIYPTVLATYRLGLFDKLPSLLFKPTWQHAYEYWELVYEVAELQEDKELQEYCLKGMIAIYPETDKSKNQEMLKLLRK